MKVGKTFEALGRSRNSETTAAISANAFGTTISISEHNYHTHACFYQVIYKYEFPNEYNFKAINKHSSLISGP